MIKKPGYKYAESIDDLYVGQRVLTPLDRIATVTKLRPAFKYIARGGGKQDVYDRVTLTPDDPVDATDTSHYNPSTYGY